MPFPSFYEKTPTITLYDPLSEFLGALEEGKMQIGYLDCVKLAGHSCPTVAGAYLMALIGLKTLFPDTLPQRGLVTVTLNTMKNKGVTGVIANVISFITGAADEGGFKGIQGKFGRDNLLSFDEAMEGEVTLTRTDTHASVTLSYDPSSIPADPTMQPLMSKILQGEASKEEAMLFGKLWQKRVEQILLDETAWNTIVTLNKEKQ